MSENPLKQYFRQPGAYVKLPTQGKWYTADDIIMSADGDIAVYPMGALDDILLNTPDAMLNGQALEKVIKNCVPDVKNVKRLMIPDLEAIFVGIKYATHNGKTDYERQCPSCQHENTFDLNCSALLDAITLIDSSDGILHFGDNLEIHIKPYDFEMRQLFIKREFEEERAIRLLDLNKEADELKKAEILAESIDRIAQLTFGLVARSITQIIMKKENITVSDPAHIQEWLISISKAQSEAVIDSVNALNAAGVPKELQVRCESCGHEWLDKLSLDPTSFFGKS